MNLRDFRIGWRLLMQEPAYSAVVTLGLAVGFAVCFLLLGYVHYCFSYDSGIPDSGQVHVIQHRVNMNPTPVWLEQMPLPVRASALRSGLAAQVSAAVESNVVFESGTLRRRATVILVDPAFAPMFGLRALEGDLAAALLRPDAIAVTVSQAQKLFGSATGVVGKSVTIDARPYAVLALLPDAPANTTVPYSTLAGIGSALWPEKERAGMLAAWQGLGGKVYVRLKPGASADALGRLLQHDFDHSPWQAMATPADLKRLGHVVDVRLRPIRDAYFDRDIAEGPLGGPRGDRRVVLGLGAIALLILALAAANYINLATVRTLRREREIAMRKVIGASPLRLVGLLMAESALVAMAAGGAGMLLAWLLLPMFSDLVDRRLEGFFGAPAVASALLATLLLGALTGLYPAAIAQRVRPAAVLAGRSGTESRAGLWLRRALSVLQFSVAIGLSAATVAIAWQARFASRSDPGFEMAPLQVAMLPRAASAVQREQLREALARLPGVQGVAVSSAPIGATGMLKWWGVVTDAQGREVPFKIQPVSPDFFRVFGVAPLHGRLFDPAIDRAEPGKAASVVITMTAVRALGFRSGADAIGKRVDGGTLTIIGVAPEFRDQSLREAVKPTVYRPDYGDSEMTLTIRSTLDPMALQQLAAPLWQRAFPDYPIDLRRQSSYYEEAYADDLRLSRLMAAATLIAVLIAAFGIYVLSAYSVQRRAREIVMRKLHGAGQAAIARLVGKEFIMLIGAGALLGLPLAAAITERYLAGFVERAPTGVWPMAAALGLAAVVVLLATARHTLAAMRVAPARALRD
jgi:putative ABC transport system permease protein